jgi:hypothetical protein
MRFFVLLTKSIHDGAMIDFGRPAMVFTGCVSLAG